jgi:hypothetical protein
MLRGIRTKAGRRQGRFGADILSAAQLRSAPDWALASLALRPVTASVRPTADGRANGVRGFAPRVGRLRRPNPRLDPTGLRPAAQPRTPLESVCVLVYTFNIEEPEPLCLNSTALKNNSSIFDFGWGSWW